MGLSGISIWQLLIVLAIVVVLFGTKRLRTLGSDLGNMIKGFKSSMNTDEKNEDKKDSEEQQQLTEQQKIAQLEQQIAAMKKANEKSDQ
jgi:sec-independent protein translocase protein TatA